MIIEMIGTPGAGKTTLLPVISYFMNEKGFQTYTVIEAARPYAKKTNLGKLSVKVLPKNFHGPMLWQIFYLYSYLNRRNFSRKNQKLIETVLTHQHKRPITDKDLKHVLRWFIHLTGYYEFFSEHLQPKDILILDEGFVHRVVQLFASENEEPNFQLVAEYLDLIPKPNLVVFTDAPEEVCKERVFSRGVWERFRDKDPNDTRKFISNASRIVEFSTNYLREKGWLVTEVQNGDQDISLAQQSLLKSLSSISF